MSAAEVDRLYRTRCAAPWQGWGVWPGQELPNKEQIAFLLGTPGRPATKFRKAEYPTTGLLHRSGPEAALAYVDKTGGVDAWQFRAPDALVTIKAAQAQHELVIEDDH